MSQKLQGQINGRAVTYQRPTPAGGVQMETFVPWSLVKRSPRMQVITPLDAPQEFVVESAKERADRKVREALPDSALIRALGLAYHWQKLLDEGHYQSMADIAEAEGIDTGRASKFARLTQLSPEVISRRIFNRGDGISLERLIRQGKFPVQWEAQETWLRTGT